jgi:hypothetical protein
MMKEITSKFTVPNVVATLVIVVGAFAALELMGQGPAPVTNPIGFTKSKLGK